MKIIVSIPLVKRVGKREKDIYLKKIITKATIQTISIIIQKFIFFVCFPIRNKYSRVILF